MALARDCAGMENSISCAVTEDIGACAIDEMGWNAIRVDEAKRIANLHPRLIAR
ncbi:hypothetical protein [Rhizobium sp. BG6]|uniref:hypothetical protein n=1 Tax=Rhizobium sp. BG6 TaxID=2613771 RepID=UPI00193EB6D1|nr:hypothetical protein [Rhizobium sp. BG6]